MRKLLYILLLVFIVILSGCTQQTPPKKTKKEVAYDNIYVNISGGGLKISRGSSFSVFVTIKNIGDVPITLKNISLLGDILQLEGDLTKKGLDEKIPPGSLYVDTFNLELSLPIGKNVLELYPAICYETGSYGRIITYFTTEDDIFSKKSSEILEYYSTRSSLRTSFYGNYIHKLVPVLEDNKTIYKSNAYFRISIIGKNPHSWPVLSCSKIADQGVRTITLEIHPDEGLEIYDIKGPFMDNYILNVYQCSVEKNISVNWGCIRFYIFNVFLNPNFISQRNISLNCILLRDIGLGRVPGIKKDLDRVGDCAPSGLSSDYIEKFLSEYYNVTKKIKKFCIPPDKRRVIEECLKHDRYLILNNTNYLNYITTKGSLKEIPISFVVKSNHTIPIASLIINLNVSYDFYETRPEAKATFEII